jgi:carboxymethylenebutenolidase
MVPPPVGRTDNLGDYGAAAQVYVSLPYNPPVGGLIFLHDDSGLTDEAKRAADMFATAGYLVVALDLFEGKVPKDRAGADKLVENINPAGVERVMRATMRYLHEEPAVRVQKVGVVAWGAGGQYAVDFARGRQDVAALVLYYSMVPDQLGSVVDLVAPTLGIFARKDTKISMARVDGFRDAMKAAGRYAEIVRYDADRGFATVGSPSYHARWARDAHQRVLSFLQRTFYVAMPTALPAP